MYKRIIKPILFSFQPERAHHIAAFFMKSLSVFPGLRRWLGNKEWNKDPRLTKRVIGIPFPNPVGLAAGFDKDAKMFKNLGQLGFGFVEIGTLTPLAQAGNPKPRLFRLPEDEALINRMGFNNGGVDDAIKRLKKRSPGLIIGGNIGKNKVTPNEHATRDYEVCFTKLHPYVDYFVVNVSSPNTPGLRELQEKEPLTKLLKSLQELNKHHSRQKPILLKIAPDVTLPQLDDILDILNDTQLDGLILTNTTLDRSTLSTDKQILDDIGNGGLSGKPLTTKALELLKYVKANAKNDFAIISVGGIHTAEDALARLEAGADLIQLYTGFVYEGAALISDINKAILDKYHG